MECPAIHCPVKGMKIKASFERETLFFELLVELSVLLRAFGLGKVYLSKENLMKAFSFFLILFLQATTQRAESRVEYCQSKADDALHRVTLSFQRSEVYLNQTSYFPLKESVRVQPSPQNDSYQFLGGLDRFSFTVTFTKIGRAHV